MINPQKPVINLITICNRFTALIYIYEADHPLDKVYKSLQVTHGSVGDILSMRQIVLSVFKSLQVTHGSVGDIYIYIYTAMRKSSPALKKKERS